MHPFTIVNDDIDSVSELPKEEEEQSSTRCSCRALQILVLTIRQHGSRATMHGLQHMFQSKDPVRQIFWLLLLVAAACIGLLHMTKTAQKFLSNPVTSQYRMMSEKVNFPDVTLCQLKPVSETLANTAEFDRYIKKKWDRFDGWYIEARKRKPNEAKVAFHERVRRIFGRLFQVLWVSGDSRDISMLDQTMHMHCTYNGDACGHKNFKLVQNFRSWNCYTFKVYPNNTATGIGGRGAELELIAFTDSYSSDSWIDIEQIGGAYRGGNQSDSAGNSVYSRSRATEETVPLSLKDFIASKSGINQLVSEGRFEPNGMRVFIHEKKIYPTLSREFVDVQSGTSSRIILRPIVHRLISNPAHECTDPNKTETVKYVRYFAHGSTHIGRREFLKTENDFVAEAKQKVVYENCACYSHRYPFEVNNSQLCYYVSPANWKSPTEQVLRNIRCHDRWIQNAEKRTYELMQQYQNRRSCQFTRYRPWEQSIAWPRIEHVLDIWQDLITPHIANGREFLPNDIHDHHIFNRTAFGYNRSTSRQEMMYYPLLLANPRCLEYFCNLTASKGCSIDRLRQQYLLAGECISLANMATNLATIRISLLASTADGYVEERSYHWTEALSETGGILGLWIGVSVLAMLELLEFLYILICNCGRGCCC